MKHSQVRRSAVRIRQFALLTLNGECSVCGFHAGRILRLHHIIPVSEGGTNDASNLILLCPNCHDLVHEAARRFFGPSHNDASRREMDKSWEKFQEFRKSLRQAYDEFEATMIEELGQKAGYA